jgi:hypothetical protein
VRFTEPGGEEALLGSGAQAPRIVRMYVDPADITSDSEEGEGGGEEEEEEEEEEEDAAYSDDDGGGEMGDVDPALLEKLQELSAVLIQRAYRSWVAQRSEHDPWAFEPPAEPAPLEAAEGGRRQPTPEQSSDGGADADAGVGAGAAPPGESGGAAGGEDPGDEAGPRESGPRAAPSPARSPADERRSPASTRASPGGAAGAAGAGRRGSGRELWVEKHAAVLRLARAQFQTRGFQARPSPPRRAQPGAPARSSIKSG